MLGVLLYLYLLVPVLIAGLIGLEIGSVAFSVFVMCCRGGGCGSRYHAMFLCLSASCCAVWFGRRHLIRAADGSGVCEVWGLGGGWLCVLGDFASAPVVKGPSFRGRVEMR